MATQTSSRVRPQAEPPSKTRYWVIVFAVTLAILAYIDRVCISQAAIPMSADLGLTKTQMGWVFSSFAIAYALFEIPGGWMGDWMGARKVLMRIVVWWSVFTALTGAVWSYWSLLITRFLFGAGEAGCFPNLTKAFSAWLPKNEQVRAQGIMWMFARWGGAFTPPLVIWTFKIMSWRWAFVAFAVLGFVWAAFFYAWFRDRPREHKGVNAGELALLKDNEHLASGHGDVPWGKLTRSRTVWLLWLQYFLLSYPWYFYITWLPTFLKEKYPNLSDDERAYLAIFPLFFGGLGSLFCGWITPRVVTMMGDVGRARKTLASAGFAGGALMLYLCTQQREPIYVMLMMGMASFCNDLVMPGAWTTCMDVGGKYAGTVAGSMNMMGNLAGFVAPNVAPRILEMTGNNWNAVLYSMAGAYVIGTLCWPLIDPTTPLEEDEARH